MKIFYGYKDLAGKLKDPIVAIGIFDGIHIGHKRIIKKVLNAAAPGSDRVILTFDPHPQSVLRPDKEAQRIMSTEHRLFIFEKMGLDAAVVINFTPSFAMMSPEDFVKRVLNGMGARKVYVGGNFHFGKGKKGDVRFFREVSARYGVEVEAVRPVKKRGKTVSSTWLRQLIRKGDIAKAEKLLRRPVSIFGTVVSGDKRGTALGIPTANIDPHHEVVPPSGVYAVKADLDGALHDGVMNIGFKPTFYGNALKKRKEPVMEVHLLDRVDDLYGKTMEIFFIQKLRSEKKFRDEQKLTRQITKDIRSAQKALTNKKAIRKIQKYKYLVHRSIPRTEDPFFYKKGEGQGGGAGCK
ncbi:MAG: bifunctional riboflavin kinase/FAD synthetase [Candidatus Omnitrophota bacterium]